MNRPKMGKLFISLAIFHYFVCQTVAFLVKQTLFQTCIKSFSRTVLLEASSNAIKYQRTHLDSLKVNQQLLGKVVQKFEGRKGSKAWVDAGIYYSANNGETRSVNAMIRLDKEKTDALKWPELGDQLHIYVAEVQNASKRLIARLSPKTIPHKFKPKYLLSELKTGQKLQGKVVNVLPFAAFIDCGVGILKPSGGFTKKYGILHINDIGKQVALSHQVVRSADVKTVIEKHMDIDVYVKRVSPASAQFSLTLDQEISEEKLQLQREAKLKARRQLNNRKPLNKLQVGEERPAQILEVKPYGFIVDTGARRRGLVHLKSIKPLLKNAQKDDDFIDLTEYADPGDWIKAKVSSVEGSKLFMELVDFVETRSKTRSLGTNEPDKSNWNKSQAWRSSQTIEIAGKLETENSSWQIEKQMKNVAKKYKDNTVADQTTPMTLSDLFGGDADDDDDDEYY